jgi:hypothetical protein
MTNLQESDLCQMRQNANRAFKQVSQLIFVFGLILDGIFGALFLNYQRTNIAVLYMTLYLSL